MLHFFYSSYRYFFPGTPAVMAKSTSLSSTQASSPSGPGFWPVNLPDSRVSIVPTSGMNAVFMELNRPDRQDITETIRIALRRQCDVFLTGSSITWEHSELSRLHDIDILIFDATDLSVYPPNTLGKFPFVSITDSGRPAVVGRPVIDINIFCDHPDKYRYENVGRSLRESLVAKITTDNAGIFRFGGFYAQNPTEVSAAITDWRRAKRHKPPTITPVAIPEILNIHGSAAQIDRRISDILQKKGDKEAEIDRFFKINMKKYANTEWVLDRLNVAKLGRAGARARVDAASVLQGVLRMTMARATHRTDTRNLPIIGQSKNDTGDTPLHAAARAGAKRQVKALINKNADITIRNVNEDTPLHLAAENGHCHIVAYFCRLGAELIVQNRDKNTPLHLAAANGHLSVISKIMAYSGENDLLESHNSHGDKPLHLAANFGHGESVELLVQLGTNVNTTNAHGNTAMHLASEKGYCDVIKKLVELRGSVNSQNFRNSTPLHWAAYNGRTDVIALLVALDADISAKAEPDETAPIHRAAFMGQCDAVKKLVELKADPNARNSYQKTPLHSAIDPRDDGHSGSRQRDAIQMIDTLVALKASISAQTNSGDTALHLAASIGNFSVIAKMIELGMNPLLTNKCGDTALHRAAYHGHRDAISAIIYATKFASSNKENAKDCLIKADKSGRNTPNNRRNTPLHVAALAGHADIISMLISDDESNLNARNERGNTPLHLASEHGHLETRRRLIELNANHRIRNKRGHEAAF